MHSQCGQHLSYSDRLQMLILPSVERRRLSYDLILVYKILQGLIHSTLSSNLILQQVSHTRGHSYKLIKVVVPIMFANTFFTNRIVDLWNSLPNDAFSVQSLQAFKYSHKTHREGLGLSGLVHEEAHPSFPYSA